MIKGFSLVELIVVVTIIAVISGAGLVVFNNTSKTTKDAQKRAAVEAAAKAYEIGYDAVSTQYRSLTDADFSSGKKPSTSEINYLEGPDASTPITSKYTICATLSDSTSYCRSSAQETAFTLNPTYTPTPTPRPTNTPTPVPPTPTRTPTPTPTPIPPTPTPTPIPIKRVFITSTTYTGNVGGVSGADNICQTRANTANLGGTWRAWISDSSSSPSTRFVRSSRGYRRLDNQMVALNWGDLTDGSLINPITINEFGQNHFVGAQTNTITNGTVYTTTSSNFCNNFTSSSSNTLRVTGTSGATNQYWTAFDRYGLLSCNQVATLYCFEQ